MDSVLRGNTGKMAKDKEKRAVWTEQQEDMLMDLFEDNAPKSTCEKEKALAGGKPPIYDL